MNQKEEIIYKYFEVWLTKDGKKLDDILSNDIKYIESYGPIYNGILEVKQWFDDWNKESTVLRWDVKNIVLLRDIASVEWYFEFIYQGKINGFDGVSIIEFNDDNKIAYIREFESKNKHYSPYGEIINFRKLFIEPENYKDIIKKIKLMYIENNKVATLDHVTNVAKVSKALSKKFNLDSNVCELAAYCHDIAAIIKPKDMLTYVKENNMYLDEAEKRYPFLLHQRFSAMITKEILGIDDARVLSAIECHTTLRANPSQYDLLLFVADKLAWDQEGIPPYYKYVYESLRESLKNSAFEYIDYMLSNGQILCVHRWLDNAYKWLKNNI